MTRPPDSGSPGAPATALAHGQSFPDDGPFARKVRGVDVAVGKGEQVVLFTLLAIVILAATVQAVASKAFGHSFTWSFEIIRDGVFAIALIGAAFAAHQQRNLAMDLVSRRLPARGRMVLRVALALFTVFVAGLFMYGGEHLRRQVMLETHGHVLPMWTVAAMIPLGSALIIWHSVVQAVLDIDYLVRGKLPPERERSAH